ncbi:MAG: 50S ribosomal protein L24 [Candidatus Paceibacterota bacterium]|nr:50S ribosomal protein L24 [Candidatus Paceibacterota bacterium]
MIKKTKKNITGTKLKKGDQVLVITGKDKGKKGKIMKVLLKEARALVEGINLKKKRMRPKTSGKKGEIIEMPSPISISNVKIICPKCGKAVRIGKNENEGKKQRICKKCKQSI